MSFHCYAFFRKYCTPLHSEPRTLLIVMAEFEQKYIYLLIKDKSIIFLRYTDDIFMVWNKSGKHLQGFMNKLNQKHPSVKLDYKSDCKQIEFLDTLIYEDQQNKLQTTLFRKSSDRQNFLDAKSKHPYIHTAKHFEFDEYAQHSKNTTVTLENLLNNLLIKDTKKMFSHSKFRRLTYSIENNCFINKDAMINNASLYQ